MSGPGLAARTWQRDKLALAVVAVGSLAATVAWRGTSRPMADTVSYRAAAQVLRDGWPTLTDRTPGYPLVLLATGSSSSSTHLLFAVQLAMHVAAVVLVIDLARQVGVGRYGRAALAALLQAPAVMLSVLHEGTEQTSALLLTWIGWLLLRPVDPDHRGRRALGLGLLCGSSALVRPTFALLWIPVGLLAAWQWYPRGERVRSGWQAAGAVALPALVVVGGLTIANGIRFDSPSLTPLLPYHLSSRTSPYVENLPASYEPARSVLIRERDTALLRGESSAPANFIWEARPALERATGLHGRALDRYVLEMDLELIANNPFGYLDTVKTASVNYTNLDSQPAILGLGRPAAWAQEALHQVLLGIFALALVLVPGLALAGRIRTWSLRTLAVALLLSGYTFLVSVLVETGTARLRAPSEPLLALVFVVAVSAVRPAVRSVTRPIVDQPGPDLRT